MFFLLFVTDFETASPGSDQFRYKPIPAQIGQFGSRSFAGPIRGTDKQGTTLSKPDGKMKKTNKSPYKKQEKERGLGPKGPSRFFLFFIKVFLVFVTFSSSFGRAVLQLSVHLIRLATVF